ncbi:MAG: 5-formyltetrahydrofolate cyclo-ligase, partial [Epsilonproteobacteria bacterium]|nr:5-formyltetrahydrofolate cyclo-ligase [Campylobacterota bacterium]
IDIDFRRVAFSKAHPFKVYINSNISNNFYKKIDLSIVPVIGVDIDFKRVGFGKGFYDRFFELNRDKIDEVLFINRVGCISMEKITDCYDVEGDLYVTPNGILMNKIK